MTATPNKGYPLPVISGNPNTWGVLLNQGFGIVDSNLGGFTTINCAGSANITVTSVQAANLTIQLTGLLTGNIFLYMPAIGGFNIIDNETTGSFTVTMQSAGGGTTTVVNQGQKVFTYNDTTNQTAIVTGTPTIATGYVMGNITGSSAVAYGISLSAMLDYVFGSTQGNILYRGGASWAALGPGTSGYSLVTGGPGSNPAWTFIGGGGGGGVVSVGTSTGLTGGPITTSGTIGRDPVYDELIVIWAR